MKNNKNMHVELVVSKTLDNNWFKVSQCLLS